VQHKKELTHGNTDTTEMLCINL